jgi:hypothetical protein
VSVAVLRSIADRGYRRGCNLTRTSTRRIRGLTRVPLRIAGFGFVVIFASGIGHVVRHPVDDSGDSARIVTSLIDGKATLELVPDSFEDDLGYRPVLAEGTLINPKGACSTPGGVGPDSFRTACRVHDFGYDILRYAEGRGTRVGPWARFDLDRRLYADLLIACDTVTCEATATVYYTAVTLNSIRQGYVAPTEEPTVPWAITAVGVVGLATAPTKRLKWKQPTIDALRCRSSRSRSPVALRSSPFVCSLVSSAPATFCRSVAGARFPRLSPWRGGRRPSA